MSTPQDEIIKRQRRAEMIRLVAGSNPDSDLRQSVDFGLLGEGDKPIGSWERPRTVNTMGPGQLIPHSNRAPLDIPDQPMKYLSPRPDMIQNPAPAGPQMQWAPNPDEAQGNGQGFSDVAGMLGQYLKKRQGQGASPTDALAAFKAGGSL